MSIIRIVTDKFHSLIVSNNLNDSVSEEINLYMWNIEMIDKGFYLKSDKYYICRSKNKINGKYKLIFTKEKEERVKFYLKEGTCVNTGYNFKLITIIDNKEYALSLSHFDDTNIGFLTDEDLESTYIDFFTKEEKILYDYMSVVNQIINRYKEKYDNDIIRIEELTLQRIEKIVKVEIKKGKFNKNNLNIYIQSVKESISFLRKIFKIEISDEIISFIQNFKIDEIIIKPLYVVSKQEKIIEDDFVYL
jgi:hypothetical protein